MRDEKFAEFPFPFSSDEYRYSNNSIPLEQPCSIEVTTEYVTEIQLKRGLLERFPERCFRSLLPSIPAQWEMMELIIDQLTSFYPNHFRIEKDGDNRVFHNFLLNEKESFIIGDLSTLQQEPLDFIGRHVQEDLIVMMQRDGDLFLEAGQLCFPANWSLAFNIGMNFKDIHHPIPGFKDNNLENKILRFLLNLESGNPWWRKNWSLMAGNRLHTSLETFDEWGKERRLITHENVGKVVHLRVEVQKLFRMPKSHAILFTIHTHLLSMEELVKHADWTKQFHAILKELPPFISDYKGISLYKDTVIDYMHAHLQGAT